MAIFKKYALAIAGIIGMSMPGQALADGTSPAFPFAATATVAGGLHSFSGDTPFGSPVDDQIGLIVAGGDFVIPVTGYWNIQLGGQFRHESNHDFADFEDAATLFQGGGIGFWRDPGMGTFGVEAGFFTRHSSNNSGTGEAHFVKLGAVGEYFFSDMVTVGAFGGVLLAPERGEFPSERYADDGFYAGGYINYYATDSFAITALAQFSEMNVSDQGTPGRDLETLRVGGKLRYLTNMPGIELFAAGHYVDCDARFEDVNGGTDGVEFLAGVNIRLGGQTGSLAAIDRSNALDTRVWNCYSDGVY